MKKNNYLIPALIATVFLFWVFMITAGIVHSFLPVVPALGYLEVVVLNFFIGLAKFFIFSGKKNDSR
jgi:hypothetical protein